MPAGNAGGSPEYTGVTTNRVKLRHKRSPDLTVTDLFVASDEVRFRVKNVGEGEKRPAKIYYSVIVSTSTPPGALASVTTQGTTKHQGIVATSAAPGMLASVAPYGTTNYEGIAAITSLSRLRPGEETGDDRVTGHTVHIPSSSRVTLCINHDRRVPETNYDNNCLTRSRDSLVPDLAVTGGKLQLYKPPKKRSGWDFAWDCVTEFGCRFDTSGSSGDRVEVEVKNIGELPVTNFDVTVGYWSEGPSAGKILERTVTDMLNPGDTMTVYLHVPSDRSRWGDAGCCGATAMVDPHDRINEMNESNNKMSLTTVR